MIASLLATVLILAPAGLGEALAGTSVDEDAAEDFTRASLWAERGTAVKSPGLIVYPELSLSVLEGLEAAEAREEADAAAAAEAAVRLQTDSGGVMRFAAFPYGPETVPTGATIVMAQSEGLAIDEEGAEAFIRAMQEDDGGFAPRMGVTGGTIGSRMTATYFAAIGLDALDALDEETEREIVTYVRERQNADGGWGHSASDDRSEMWTTHPAINILHHLDALDSETAAKTARFLKLVEHPEGGFASHAPNAEAKVWCPWCPLPPPNAAATGRALGILDVLEEQTLEFDIDEHARWLADAQIEEGVNAGSFKYYPDPRHPVNRLTGPAPGSPIEGLAPGFKDHPEHSPVMHTHVTSLILSGLGAHGLLDAIDRSAAVSFLTDAQHDGTGGFGWWAGNNEQLRSTAGAHRALETLATDRQQVSQALASSLGSWQRADGPIENPRWDDDPLVEHTAFAVDALAHANRLDAIDQEEAAAYLASQQEPEGGFSTSSGNMRTLGTTWAVADALDHMGRLSVIDVDGAAQAVADRQQDNGQFGDTTRYAVWDTARGLLALEALDRLDAADVDAAVSFLAGAQFDNGSFAKEEDALFAVLGLDAVDRLDAIDRDGAEAYIEDMQRDHGGFASKGLSFALKESVPPIVRHAMALEALDALQTA